MTKLPTMSLFEGGPEVARLCLGTMMFGDRTEEADAVRILDAYVAAGGNFVDTADMYAGGRSEEIVGRWLRDRRDGIFLATKVGNAVQGVEGSGGLSRRWIAEAARASLERLQVERIDLYYLHREDDETPLEETLEAVGELLASGRIAHWGFSNFRAWKIAEMVRLADALGIERPRVAQPYYHMLNRRAEVDYLPACRHFGIGVVPYSVLARGVLTGKYRGETPAGSRAASGDHRIAQNELFPETVALAGKAADRADATGRTPVGLALQWALAADTVRAALVGPRTLEQMETYLAAVETPYGGDDEAFLSGLCAPGYTPVHGHHDPSYPLRGRRTAFDPAGTGE